MGDGERHAIMLHSESPILSYPSTTSHIYPHSHHGTPAQEYQGFTFQPLPDPMSGAGQLGTAMFDSTQQQPQPQPQSQTLFGLRWPSQNIGRHAQQIPFQMAHVPPSTNSQVLVRDLRTPISATSLRSASTPRRTLTDADRKEMCLYAEKNPDKKQTEIGAMFGVERSTVSKVLRQKDKYLTQDETTRASAKRLKNRTPDIETTLSNWAKKEEKKGLVLTNDMIRDRARAFLATTAHPENHPAMTNTWIEKFKLKHALSGARSRKGSLAVAESDTVPSGLGVRSPQTSSTVTTPDLHPSNSRESLTDESGEDQAGIFARRSSYTYMPNPQHVNLHSMPYDHTSSTLSPEMPFHTPESGTASGSFGNHFQTGNGLDAILAHDQRPRRQTVPIIQQRSHHIKPISSEETTLVFSSPTYYDPDNIDPAIQMSTPQYHQNTEYTYDRNRSITPTNAMGPPPLPSQYTFEFSAQQSPKSISFSNAEAQEAVSTVYQYIQQQISGFYSPEDGLFLERLLEKIKQQAIA